MTYNLPKPYISWSAYSLWIKSKEQFRKRYYLNEPAIETHETIYGKQIDSHLDNGGKIDGVIEYGTNQYKIEVELEGVKLLGYLDGFNEETFSILERKTGHKNPKGKSPWDKIAVQKHGQLVFYSILVELKHGKVDPVVILQWLETEFKSKEVEFDGHTLSGMTKKLGLTGRVETFKRRIFKWEREKMKKDILRVVKEISDDYAKFLQEAF